MMTFNIDIAVIGAGPAGVAAAVAAAKAGQKVVIIEREERPGGILKQCIHDGFGLKRFGVQLTGPEYAYKEIVEAKSLNIPFYLNTFLTDIKKEGDDFHLSLINKQGRLHIIAGAVISATGCRERTDRQIFIQGNRPAGIFTAGQAQYFINIQGYMPVKKTVILGSGDIGLIMARRLTLEGAEVEGVYEIKHEPSGLSRNIVQCLDDFKIPLHLGTTVLAVKGKQRVESVTVGKVDKAFNLIPGSERTIECDSLILSVGLIPENDILDPLNISIDPATSGPRVTQDMMTDCPGLFCCGNALHVNDLADFVSESGEAAGRNAAKWVREGAVEIESVSVEAGENMLYVVPQQVNKSSSEPVVIYFRSNKVLRKVKIHILTADSDSSPFEEIGLKRVAVMRPPEMERVVLTPEQVNSLKSIVKINIEGVEEVGNE